MRKSGSDRSVICAPGEGMHRVTNQRMQNLSTPDPMEQLSWNGLAAGALIIAFLQSLILLTLTLL